MRDQTNRTGYPSDYVTAKGQEKLYDQLLGAVQAVEERIVRHADPGNPNAAIGLKIPVSHGDVAFLIEDIYKRKSAITGIPTRLTLIRWRRPTESTLLRIGADKHEQKSARVKISELVCMTREEGLRHQNEILLGEKTLEELYDKEVIDRVEARLVEAAQWEQYR